MASRLVVPNNPLSSIINTLFPHPALQDGLLAPHFPPPSTHTLTDTPEPRRLSGYARTHTVKLEPQLHHSDHTPIITVDTARVRTKKRFKGGKGRGRQVERDFRLKTPSHSRDAADGPLLPSYIMHPESCSLPVMRRQSTSLGTILPALTTRSCKEPQQKEGQSPI